MKRKILYLSGTRADFGLLESTLLSAATHPQLDVCVCVTGMHLSAQFGNTQTDVEKSGLRICARIPVNIESDHGASMTEAIGQILLSLPAVLIDERPDIVLTLGDRGEMLAAALAGVHLGNVVVHIHGGERSGTVDESLRHAISKLAHYHFVATVASRERLIRMGERADAVFVTGAPGLDGLREQVCSTREELAGEVGLNATQPIALTLFHPVVQDAAAAGRQAQELRDALVSEQLQVVCLLPNADAGSVAIRKCLIAAESSRFRVFQHLPRPRYVSWMAAADVMVGNSSSGIIEAASFNLPVVNVGDRQQLRERSGNVLDCEPKAAEIAATLRRALAMRGRSYTNVYGDGRAGMRIVDYLATVGLQRSVLKKCNVY